MNDYLNNKIDPVCKFGPGGDFVSNWPPQPHIPTKIDIITKTTITTVSQSSLFAEDLQIPIKTVHKKKPQIKLHRRTPKRSVTYDVSDQGMLFEAGQKNARTA